MPRSLATELPPDLEDVAGREGGFPRYVWHVQADTCYEGRLINRESGEYKGYPLEGAEWRPGM